MRRMPPQALFKMPSMPPIKLAEVQFFQRGLLRVVPNELALRLRVLGGGGVLCGGLGRAVLLYVVCRGAPSELAWGRGLGLRGGCTVGFRVVGLRAYSLVWGLDFGPRAHGKAERLALGWSHPETT